MNSGTDILAESHRVEVINISPHGFWILINDKEYFISYEDYPVFTKASILEIASVDIDAFGNLHWRMLDADIAIKALENPEDYPLVYKP